MTVRVGKITFSDWVSLYFTGGWTDTFIFRIDARNCLPPFGYRPLLQRMSAYMLTKRSSASLWIQVDSPGDWYYAEVKRAFLPGLKLPYTVTRIGEEPEYVDFSFPPKLLYSASPHPPTVAEKLPFATQDELRCLQVLGRINKGNEQEIASLAGLPENAINQLLANLKKKKLAIHKTSPKVQRGKSKPVQMDLFPLWHVTSRGLSLVLRSWGVPKGIEFKTRTEENLHQIGTNHRQISRKWPAWLRSAWPHSEIWMGWSEVGIPGSSVLPDGLAWGRIHGYEVLFWLEVGDHHKSRRKIEAITSRRLDEAWKFCERTGMRLVYAQLSTNWVLEAAHWACVKLPEEVAVVMGNMRRSGELPTVEWGKITGVRDQLIPEHSAGSAWFYE